MGGLLNLMYTPRFQICPPKNFFGNKKTATEMVLKRIQIQGLAAADAGPWIYNLYTPFEDLKVLKWNESRHIFFKMT